jgi:hypothetical protein
MAAGSSRIELKIITAVETPTEEISESRCLARKPPIA